MIHQDVVLHQTQLFSLNAQLESEMTEHRIPKLQAELPMVLEQFYQHLMDLIGTLISS